MGMRFAVFPMFLGFLACAPLAQIEPVPNDTEVSATVTAPPPPASARTVEQFDTTSEAERVAAAAPSAGGARLGEVVATLGDAATPGFWVETPLVDTVTTGRAVNVANGKSVEVELRPVQGSTRVSLAALRLLEAPLTELVTLEVFRL